MNLDEQAKKHGVASLELSKELEKVGMPQDKSLWYWVDIPLTPYLVMKCCSRYIDAMTGAPVNLDKSSLHPLFAAPHATDLADVLPNGLNVFKVRNNIYMVYYDKTSSDYFTDTLPNALAKMVKYLLDKGIIKK